MSDNTATQQPRLEARIREACRVRHYSLATERASMIYTHVANTGASTCLVFPLMDSAKQVLRDMWNRRTYASN